MMARLTMSTVTSTTRRQGPALVSSSRLLRQATKPQPNKDAFSTTEQQQHQHELFKPWGVQRIEANGDYRNDTWLEKHIGGALYQHQDCLPRLPVPSVAETLQRFLPTAMPLAESVDEERTLQQAVDAFPKQSASLQSLLEQRAASPEWKDSSWLQHWWNTGGYLQVRDSVVINVSYFFDFADDPSCEASATKRGAAMLTAVAEFRQRVCSGQQPAEMVGRKTPKPLCSTAYKYMFHACRIPQPEQDSYRVYDPSLHHHAIVARKGHFFRVDFCDPITGHPHSLASLEQALETCLQRADQLERSTANVVPKMGWLTSQTRDDWAYGRAALLQFGGHAMEQALDTLESGAVLLCLDDEAPVSRQESSTLYLHGNGGSSGANRWFDKSVQILVCNNGKAGFLGEHSMMDGMPVVTLADHLTKRSYGQLAKEQFSSTNSTGTVKVDSIFGPDVYPAMQQASSLVQKAHQAHLDWTDKNVLHVQSFHGYGSNFIKQSGFSPDAFVQVAMQVATARLFRKQAGTYEATQVRPFLHGRTETTRSVSTESAALVQALGPVPQFNEEDPAVVQHKLDLLQKAVMAHVKYIGLAAQAQGVDRHFLGLAMIASEADYPLPDLYDHPVFARAKRWRVSTSHLTHPRFENWGYGEVVPDGVGLSYSIHPRHCVFSVTALREHGWTDKLCELLQESLLELRRLIEAKGDDAAPKSKL